MLDGPSPALPSVDAAGASATAAPVVHVVGLWRRTAAALLDTLLLLPVLLLIAWVLSWVLPQVPARALQQLRVEVLIELLLRADPIFVGVVLFGALLGTLYQLLFISGFGATPGLRLVGATVIDVYGARPGAWRVLLRCLGQGLGLLLLGLGLLWAGFDAEKRSLQDWLAGTYVIRARPPEPRRPSARANRAPGGRGALAR